MIKKVFNEEVTVFKVIHPEDITDDGCYSIGDGNAKKLENTRFWTYIVRPV